MFLATKLFLPHQPPGAVLRERLYSALDEGWEEQTRLFLLSAPPGYGKTTLLSGWIKARNIPFAWVSLGTEENDPGQFLQLLIQALEPHFPDLVDLRPMISLPQARHLNSLVVEMVNRIVQAKSPVVLALDDYHLITAQVIHELMQLLIDYLPPQFYLAVLTREDPPFALGRLRVRRQILEIRARELAFSNQEGHDLLIQNLRLPLDTEQVTSLVERTEGWAAGLQLAALTLKGNDRLGAVIESFKGSNRFVLDYFAGEVLDRLSPELRSFLCRSAVLDRFNAELCNSALEIEYSQNLLSTVAAANLFLISLDEENNWFRYHHLAADILKAEITPDDRRGICRRAAQWWQNRGQLNDAVRYALMAKDFEGVCELLLNAVIPAAEGGLISTASGWLDTIPAEILLQYPELCAIRAWFLIFTGRFREAAGWTQQIVACEPQLPRQISGLLAGLQGWIKSVSGQPLNAAQLIQAYQMTEGKYSYFSPMLLLAVGQAQKEIGEFSAALSSFEEGASLAEASSGAISALIIRNNQAFLLNSSGERQAARQLCLNNIEQYSSPDGKPGLLAGIPLLPSGCFLYESGKLEAAYHTLTQSINLIRRLGLYDILTSPANYDLQYVLAGQGRLEEALALNKEARRHAAKAGLQVVVNGMDLLAAWLHLHAGDPAPANHWAASHPLSTVMNPYSPLNSATLLHARVLSSAGQNDRAIQLLLPLLEKARRTGLKLSWVHGSVELALIYLASDRFQDALEIFIPAAESAFAMEYFQVFRQYSAILTPLLHKLHAAFPAFLNCVTPSETQTPEKVILVETLTSREMEILRLVAAGLSNADIAERLFLTTGTVKWYANQIFGKLSVSRRTEAVAKAREIGLL